MDNLGWGLQITALGMGLVFGLLALLWGLLSLALKLDRPPAPAAVQAPQPTLRASRCPTRWPTRPCAQR
jgi:Na+-transporting methylmalonyl-CoA/oxaloacetate decarboxylase gamma subunit